MATYKQTILGPIWFFIQPLFTTLIFTVVFGQLASISTDGLPQILFYMCGITCWNYFAECLTKTSSTFVANANIFGKVYFSSTGIAHFDCHFKPSKIRIQFLLFIGFLLFYYQEGSNINPNKFMLLLPLFLLVLMAGLGLGFGILITSLTTKYRDFQFLVAFGIQLFMYATPIVYPLSLAKEKLGSYSWVAIANPMTSVIEAMKYAFLGQGELNWYYLIYTTIFMVILLFIGVVTFNKVEQTFMDTV